MTPLDRADRLEWESWVLAEQAKLTGDATTSGISEWNHSKLDRYRVAGRSIPAFVDNPQGAYAGPWHIVKHWASPEFVEHIDRYGNPRYSFAEWQRRAREQRATLAAQEQEYADDVARPLDSLAYWRELDDARGTMILEARKRGASWADICQASGLSRQQANTLANRASDDARAVAASEYVHDETPF